MINKLKALLGIRESINYSELVKKGAIIIDVRTKSEYQSGNVPKSINIPLNDLDAGCAKIPKTKIIITCCASGIRSANAKSKLKSMGYTEVHNGGSWSSLLTRINI